MIPFVRGCVLVWVHILLLSISEVGMLTCTAHTLVASVGHALCTSGAQSRENFATNASERFPVDQSLAKDLSTLAANDRAAITNNFCTNCCVPLCIRRVEGVHYIADKLCQVFQELGPAFPSFQCNICLAALLTSV